MGRAMTEDAGTVFEVRESGEIGPLGNRRFSVIVPFVSAIEDWTSLLTRFEPLQPRMRELIFVLDGFRQDPPVDAPSHLVVTSTSARVGPAGARNLGAENATGDILAFTDDDCVPDPDWLDAIAAVFVESVDTVVGGVRISPAGWLGDAISMLGFPAGGNLGFSNVWTVRPDNTTDHLSACNIAIRRAVFWRVGGFDSSFPFPGGEDNELAFRLRRQGSVIVFSPASFVTHPARHRYPQFVAWQFRRGRGQYYLVRKVGSARLFVLSRLRLARRVLCATWRRPYFAVMPILIGMMFLAQTCGYLFERLRIGRRPTARTALDEPQSQAASDCSAEADPGPRTQ